MKIPPDRQQNKIAFDFLKTVGITSKELKLLDVGAADEILKPFLPKNVKYFSLDVKDHEGHKHDFTMDLDKDKIPVKDGFFDIVLVMEVLEHTMRPQEVINELKRVSKKDAIFVISLPNEYNFLLRIYYLLAIKKEMEAPWRVVEDHLHIQKPRVEDIIRLASQNFKIHKIKFHWESRMSSTRPLFVYIDKFINIFAKIYPSLFARDVVLLCSKESR